MAAPPDAWERIRALLKRYPAGVHVVRGPAPVVDTALPTALIELYKQFDGGEMFFETVQVTPSRQVRVGADGRTCFGELSGDALLVDEQGRVWRREADTDEVLAEGSRLDRWLWGTLEAEALLYDKDGEFADATYSELGEQLAATEIAQCRAVLRRDRKAPAPRWRLARVLAEEGKLEEAREELEEVIDLDPCFAWAWFELARCSEALGELDGALEEAVTAAEAQQSEEHAAFFWAWAARLARAVGDEPRRAELAAKALAAGPELAREQKEGAEALLAEGDVRGARELAELAAALTPRDLPVLELLRRLAPLRPV